ncbi:glutathione S-transferase T3 isoform X1 [Arabidopsis lyrata subsp. lyrata]|uniref:glutathione S-transferase T3 isoform X1 n=1 Tax=Arabidopsis lyrata subsp. lyrata TaxID=81972 RepID=UPI000A29AF33|nr:glutathione S-transferase T3 isoform X1 [Arabidopsis lyrata subsp. lyrata]|eukprot:XP_020886262.1 glutathione S-transferase T3 isoform X1 [Arabidopsis lyrata subsp. lyrata]
MDSRNPYTNPSSFLNLLSSQQDNPMPPPNQYAGFSFSAPWIDPNQAPTPTEEPVADRKSRRKWSPTEDVILISAWLNTSKDVVVSNEQKATAFWQRIADYFAASPKLRGLQKRAPLCCKQRWAKINEGVCKFVGSYEAATKQQTSGQNENDVVNLAHQIFYNDHKAKFTLEHAWRELRHDQKWCGSSTSKDSGSAKRKRFEDGSAQASCSMPVNIDEEEPRPTGVKAAKATAKAKAKTTSQIGDEDKTLKELHCIWEIKEKDLVFKEKLINVKEKLSRTKLLDTLMLKTEPLTDIEMTLKNKLIMDLLS